MLRYGDDLAEQVRKLTDGVGVAAVYDGVGRNTFDASLDCLRIRGMLALFGAASGPVPPVDPQRLSRGGSPMTSVQLGAVDCTASPLPPSVADVMGMWHVTGPLISVSSITNVDVKLLATVDVCVSMRCSVWPPDEHVTVGGLISSSAVSVTVSASPVVEYSELNVLLEWMQYVACGTLLHPLVVD